MDESTIIRLIQKAFKADEWQYLQSNPVFQDTLKERNNASHEDYEYLIEVGELLLRRKRELGMK